MLFALIVAFVALGKGGSQPSAYGNWVRVIAAAGTVLALFSGTMLYRDIVTPLRRILTDIENMSAGDLSGKIAAGGDDEFGATVHASKVFQCNVKLLIGQIKESTGQVSEGAEEIARGNTNLSERTESQASSLEQTAAALLITCANVPVLKSIQRIRFSIIR